MNNALSGYSPRQLLHWVNRFTQVPVLVVGDLMIDRSFRGPAERISPEAPVPVIHVQQQTATPGGAGNVANNLSVLGAAVTLVSVCGDDAAGEEIQDELRSRGIATTGVLCDPGRPTITKTRVFAGHQQVARFDFEKRGDLPDDVHSDLLGRLRELIPAQACVVISDYGKGVVTPEVIRTCLREAKKRDVPVIVDPKIEHFMQYRGVDCITPNTKEAVEGLRALPPRSEEDVLRLGQAILRRLRCRSLLITRSEKGMTLFQDGTAPRTIPAVAQEVYDVTGAGDTVVATFSAARAAGAPHAEAAVLSNLAAGIVVAKVGTAVATRDELVQRVKGA